MGGSISLACVLLSCFTGQHFSVINRSGASLATISLTTSAPIMRGARPARSFTHFSNSFLLFWAPLASCRMAGWLFGWLAGWLLGSLAGWLVGWLAGRLAGWLVGSSAGWLVGEEGRRKGDKGEGQSTGRKGAGRKEGAGETLYKTKSGALTPDRPKAVMLFNG